MERSRFPPERARRRRIRRRCCSRRFFHFRLILSLSASLIFNHPNKRILKFPVPTSQKKRTRRMSGTKAVEVRSKVLVDSGHTGKQLRPIKMELGDGTTRGRDGSDTCGGSKAPQGSQPLFPLLDPMMEKTEPERWGPSRLLTPSCRWRRRLLL